VSELLPAEISPDESLSVLESDFLLSDSRLGEVQSNYWYVSKGRLDVLLRSGPVSPLSLFLFLFLLQSGQYALLRKWSSLLLQKFQFTCTLLPSAAELQEVPLRYSMQCIEGHNQREFDYSVNITALRTAQSGRALSFTASLPSPAIGSYSYEVRVMGSSREEYSVLYEEEEQGGGGAFAVTGSDSPLPAPSLTSAVFSADGSYLTLSFDSLTHSLTDRAGGGTLTVFTCSLVVDFTCAAQSQCQWLDAKTVLAYISGESGCASPGDMCPSSPGSQSKPLVYPAAGRAPRTLCGREPLPPPPPPPHR
jgi:hypothetical protein